MVPIATLSQPPLLPVDDEPSQVQRQLPVLWRGLIVQAQLHQAIYNLGNELHPAYGSIHRIAIPQERHIVCRDDGPTLDLISSSLLLTARSV